MRESLNLSQDEAEAISFVPSAISIPQKFMFWCDNRCGDKALRFWLFASVVVEDVEGSYTVNLCQQCYSKSLTAKGLAPFEELAVEGSRGKKAHRGRLWRTHGKDQYIQGMWEYFSLERVKAKKLLKDAEKEK